MSVDTDTAPVAVEVSSPGIALKAKIGFLILLVIGMGYVHWMYGEQVGVWVSAALITVFVFFVIVLIVYVVRLILHIRFEHRLRQERLRQEKERTAQETEARRKMAAEAALVEAQAAKAQAESEFSVVTVPKDVAIYLRELNKSVTWTMPDRIPKWRINGNIEAPTPLEISSWQAWLPAGHPTGGSVQSGALPLLAAGETLPDKVDLLPLLYGGRGSLRRIILGISVNAQGQLVPLSAPISRLVHVGIGGATDSGKSMLGRVIAYQVVTAAEPVQVAFSDLKKTTFKVFQGLPEERMPWPIMETEQGFFDLVRELFNEVERRKALFSPYLTVECLEDYNRMFNDTPEKKLPVIVFFIDEISNVFVERGVTKLSLRFIREARGFGIYVIGMGQNWSHREMSTSFREQFRTAIHFGTNNPHSSRMLLNSDLAVNIRRQGEAYVLLPYSPAQEQRDPLHIQAPYLEPATILQMLYRVDSQDPFVVDARGRDRLGEDEKEDPMEHAEEEEAEDDFDQLSTRQQILRLWDNDVRQRSAILEQVYGPDKKSGGYYTRVNKVLLEAGRITQEELFDK